MNKKDSIIKLEGKLKSNNIGDLLPVIFSQFSKDLKPLLINFFEQVDDSLFDRAEKASSNNLQAMYFESMRFIRKSRKTIYLEFFKNIKQTFQLYKKGEYDYFIKNDTINPKTKALKLTLVDEKELDETLAKTNLINKSEMAFHENIFALLKRFSVLASGSKLKSEHNPIGPHVIVNSFANSIKNLALEVNVNLIVYKLFERNVMSQLNSVYNNVNDILARQGVIPEIQYNVPNQSSQQENVPSQNVETKSPAIENQPSQKDISNNQTSATNQNVSDENYQLISNLFKHSNPDNISSASSQNNAQPVSNIDLNTMLNALSVLQTDLLNKTKFTDQDSRSPTEIKQELLDQLHALDASSDDKVVKKKDEDTIDLVGMLFQFIVDDRNLPAKIQVILARLQIPYLKIALEDKNLFADKTHPARMLLDKLSIASVGWTKESDNRNKFIDKLSSITKQIFDAQSYNQEFFETIINDFDKFRAKQKKKSKVLQKRTQEKSLGQDKIQQAKEITAQLLVSKMTNKHMPILVRDILLGEWSNVLVLKILRHGKNSSEFTSKSNFIETIINSCNKDLEITKQDIENLSKHYESGLKLVAFNAKEIIDKQHDLVKCIQEIHEIQQFETESCVEIIAPEEVLKLSEIRKEENDIIEFIEEIIEPSIEDEVVESIEDDYAKKVKELKVGSWLEFSKENSDPIRAKLSWISPITTKYLFVNSRGLKITDKTTNSLAKGLREKTIRILQQVALFDRALSAIATKMQSNDKDKDKDKE